MDPRLFTFLTAKRVKRLWIHGNFGRFNIPGADFTGPKFQNLTLILIDVGGLPQGRPSIIRLWRNVKGCTK